MKLKLLTLGLLLLITSRFSTIYAQDTVIVKRDALAHTEALNRGDYDTYANYMHPKVMTMMGGRDRVIALVKQVIETSEKKGNGIRGSTLGVVSKFYPSGKEIYCTLPYSLSMNVQGGYATIESSLLGISSDQGKSWKFISSGNVPREVIKKAFPGLPDDLKISPKGKPVVHRED